ncbi:MAG: DUF484 family protein [Desulfomonilia bacterium]|jgi:diguanylate cyclase (GGDEF)-like protein
MVLYTDAEIRGLLRRVRENEETARKFFEVESSVLSTLDFEDFFHKLLTTIMDRFQVGHVWITLIDTGRASRLLKDHASSSVNLEQVKIVDGSTFSEVMTGLGGPVLANRDLGRFAPLFPDGIGQGFESLALIPIVLDGEPAGSLNFADASAERFSPDSDTSLLQQLGVVVSICLSNVSAHEEIKALAFRDPLTGLLNRRAMESALDRELSRAKRYGGSLSVVFIDLDDFKKINDTLGHDCGDELLVSAASAMLGMVRLNDIVSRFAGDEFVIILPQTSPKEAENLLKRMVRHFEENPARLRGTPVTVRFSYGIASPDLSGDEDAASLLKKADDRLYQHKRSRKAAAGE